MLTTSAGNPPLMEGRWRQGTCGRKGWKILSSAMSDAGLFLQCGKLSVTIVGVETTKND